MKKNIFIYAIAVLVGFSSCSLDELPAGSTVTEDQKQDVVKADPEKFSAEVNAFAANLIKYNTLGLSGVQHYDFGFAGVCIMHDSAADDFVGDNIGYNWFAGALIYSNKLATSTNSTFIWKMFYNNVKQANDILVVVNDLLESATNKQDEDAFNFFKGQALTYRAFSYLNLIQSYQLTYVGHEDAPGVPLTLTEGDERATAKRATVREVYEVILDDLTQAIAALEGKKRSLKSEVSVEVAYGLRARAHLVMNNWKEAAADAKRAQEGFTPYALKTLSEKPSLNNASATSWMWANLITPDNDIVKTGLLNWPSHICSLTGNGYTTGADVYKRINMHLWAQIPESDVRRHWWLDENRKSPWYDDVTVGKDPETGEPIVLADYLGWPAYTNLKFGPYEDKLMNAVNACDWPLMRVEEMILIEAEALAMSGNLAGGKAVLSGFLKGYRDEGYEGSTASSPEEFQDEVWLQRKIELWGEGFSLYDLLRLKKPTVRYTVGKDENGKDIAISNYDATSRINLNAEDPILIYLLPEAEIEANLELEDVDNNPTIPRPTPTPLK